jgi:cbb3-type cytochrome oxidase subunit 1
MSGIVLLVLPLAIGGVEQGMKLNNPSIAFMDATKAMLPFLRTSTIGLLLILLGNSLFALNIFAMTFVWEKSLVKKAFAVVTAPLEKPSASASLRRDQGEVKA